MFGNYYGTPRAPVEAALAAGRDVLFDIDWQGTQQLAQNARDDLVSVFILPPSTARAGAAPARRARPGQRRGGRARMAKAADEMSHWAEYDYIIVNHDLEASVGEVRAILTAERLRRERQVGLARVRHARCAERSVAAHATRARERGELRDRQVLGARASASMPAAASRAPASPPSAAQALAQHLAALAEGGGGDALQIARGRRARAAAARGIERTTLEVTLGGGVKARGGEVEAAARLGAAPLREHREPAVVLAARRGDEAVGDLLLEHQGQATRTRRRAPASREQRRRDVVGQVGDDPPRRRRRALRASISSASPSTIVEPARDRPRRSRRAPARQRASRSIAITRGRRASSSARVRPPGPGPISIVVPCASVAGGARDPAREVEVEQEMLAERALGAEAVARDDLAQRRQRRARAIAHYDPAACARAAAMWIGLVTIAAALRERQRDRAVERGGDGAGAGGAASQRARFPPTATPAGSNPDVDERGAAQVAQQPPRLGIDARAHQGLGDLLAVRHVRIVVAAATAVSRVVPDDLTQPVDVRKADADRLDR